MGYLFCMRALLGTTAASMVAAVALSGCAEGTRGKPVTVTGTVVMTAGAGGAVQPVGGTVVVTGISTPANMREDIAPGQTFSFQLLKATYLFSLEGTTAPCAPVTVNVRSNMPPVTITCQGL